MKKGDYLKNPYQIYTLKKILAISSSKTVLEGSG